MSGYRYQDGVHLNATVTPYAACVIFHRCGPDLEREVRRLDAAGHHALAHQLLDAVAQLRRAGGQVPGTSGIGRSDGPIGATPAAWEQHDGGLTSHQAARLLGVSPRQVTRLAEGEQIRGVRVAGRWQLDPRSVTEHASRRRQDQQ